MASSAPPDSKTIRLMFDRLAGRYDLFNRLTSMGLDRRWRSIALKPVQNGMRVLDLGCGTGDLAFEASRRMDGTGEVIGLDFSQEMLRIAVHRHQNSPLRENRIRFVQGRAEDLPLEAEPYDLAVSGFVLRNLYENIDRILSGVRQSLREGGRISFLDITEPSNPVMRALWRLYMSTLVVLYGKILFGKDYPSFYLTESAHRFVKPAEFIEKLQRAGFRETRSHSLFLGIITLYEAAK